MDKSIDVAAQVAAFEMLKRSDPPAYGRFVAAIELGPRVLHEARRQEFGPALVNPCAGFSSLDDDHSKAAVA